VNGSGNRYSSDSTFRAEMDYSCARCGAVYRAFIASIWSSREEVLTMHCIECGTIGAFTEEMAKTPDSWRGWRPAVTLAPEWLLEYGRELATVTKNVGISNMAWSRQPGRDFTEMLTGRLHAPRTEVPRWNALARLLPSVKLTLREESGQFHTAKFTAQALWDAFAGHLLACGWWLEMGVPVCPVQLAGTRAHWRLAKTLRSPEAVAAALPAMQAKLAALEAIPRHVLES